MHLLRLAASSLIVSASLPQVSPFSSSSRNFISKLSIISIAARRSFASETECNAYKEEIQSQMYDTEYPGTAVQRLNAVHERVKVISADGSLNGRWEEVRRRILWAGGLR